MTIDRSPFPEESIPQFNIARLAGFVLIAAAIFVGCWQVYLIGLLFTAPQELGLLAHLANADTELRLIVNDQTLRVQVPGLFTYGVPLLLLLILIKLVSTFVNLGNNLLRNR